MEDRFEPKDISALIKRRKKSFIIVFSLISFIGICIALILPPIYQSKARILIEGQQIPQDYVKSTITSYVEERLETISQQVMSRSKLMEIIDKFNLYSKIKDKKTTTEIIEKMRKAINLQTIDAEIKSKSGGRNISATIAFTLSYEGKNPANVQKVTNELSSLYIEEDLKTREKLATVTADFLQEELETLKKQIQLHEEKIIKFKENHIGNLPSDYRANLQTISRLEREFDQINMQKRLIEEKKLYLEGQIANIDPLTPIMIDGKNMAMNPKERLKHLHLQLSSLQTTLSEKHPDIKKLKREIAKLEAQVGKSEDSAAIVKRLNELENQLSVAKGKLGAKHPDVLRLTKEIELLSKELNNSPTKSATTKVAEEKPDNPTYINLKTQIVSSENEIKFLKQQKEKIKQEIEKYQKRIDNAPSIEKEHNDLTRDYESAKHKYQEIMGKLMTANIAQGMEDKQRGERFLIKSRAYLPEKPFKPNRIGIILLGFILAIGSGVVLSAFQESFDNSIKTSNQIKSLTGVPVFSTISLIETDQELRSRRIRKMLWIFAVISFVGITLFLIDHFIMKLDIMWMIILDRIKMIV